MPISYFHVSLFKAQIALSHAKNKSTENNFAFSFKHIILRETINFIEYTAMKNEKKNERKIKGRRRKIRN